MFKKEYNESYIKKWLYFDHMKKSMRQVEINKHETLVDDFSKYDNEFSVTFDKEFSDYLNNDSNVSFYEIIENDTLRTAYKCLTDREKHVIDLYYHQSFTQIEIAEIIGLKQGTVANTLKRAVKKLSSLMNEKNVKI